MKIIIERSFEEKKDIFKMMNDGSPRNSARNSRRIGLLMRKVQPPPREKKHYVTFIFRLIV